MENAFTANHMVNGREYLVKSNGVLPVDFESTGVVQLDTKWGDCLHQFLEIKHGKKLSHITLETNFISNQEDFSRYMGKIFGVSGTLGKAREKSFFERQFKLRCQKIPTHRTNVFEELPGLICDTKPEWIIDIQDIRDQVTKTSNDKQRAVLVICEDINTAEELKNNLTEKFSLYGFTDIVSLKHLRDAMEEQRIVDIEKHDFAEVQLKEKLFACYCSFLLEIKQQLNFNGIDEKIMLDSLHEYWGMWCRNVFFSELKALGSTVTSQSLKPVFKTACVAVGKEVGLQLAKRTGKYLLEVVQEKVKIHFERIAEERLKQETQFAFTKADTYATTEDFISFHCKNSITKKETCYIYMEIIKKSFCLENIRQFRQVLVGCVKDVIKPISVQLKTQTDIFVECKPIFNIINGIACASYDVKQLVALYCEHINSDIKDIYSDLFKNEASGYSKEVNTDECMIRQVIIDQKAQFLFGLLKESFEFTGSGILAEKLQVVVEKSLSNIAADGIDKFANDDIKPKANFALNATKKGIKALQFGKGEKMVDAIADITTDGIEKFANDEIKDKVNFSLNLMHQSRVKALKSGQIEDAIDAATDIAANGTETCANDEIKEKTNFALVKLKRGIKALQSGKAGDMFEATKDIVVESIVIADDDIKQALSASKKGFTSILS
ncbi:unnamed protein product [Mytilus coruscus]|uniref:SecA family profile domain-containing protein n=1 Tax=Mytilus coruscus TaxID=42192 RepID=A0A6J8C2M3_MYTCO|nr:unnamed protein product [Mytilus coruscus]